MEFLQLQYFVRVAEQGGFTTAALQLGITQPALSRKVRALEVELRTHLFRRTGRGAQLTPEGRRFLDHARGVLHGADAAMRSVRKGAASYEGRVALGLPPSVGKLVIPPLVSEFARRFPKASVSVVEGLSHALYDQLLTGRLDFAVTRNPAPSPHLSIELLTTEAFYLVGAKPVGRSGHPVTLSDLVGLSFIMPTAPHSFRQILEAAMARMNTVLNVNYEIDAVASLLDLAAAGLGYTLIPDSTLRTVPVPRHLSWQKIAAPELYTRLCFITPARRPEAQLTLEAAYVTRDVLLRELCLERTDERTASEADRH
jgi:LysR family nitrogen assimilation transcriptional regulator